MLSLGDAIVLQKKFKRFGNHLRFQSKIRDKFGSRFLIVATKSIKSCPDCIEKVEIFKKKIEFIMKVIDKRPKS